MKLSRVGYFARCARDLALAALLWARVAAGAPQAPQNQAAAAGAESTLVRVDITVTAEGDWQLTQVADQQLRNYHPKVIQTFPSTGVVIDDKGHIMTFLGYSWVDCEGPNRQVDVVMRDGTKSKGKLVGIDQTIGVAVVRSLAPAGLVKTPMCVDCAIRDGATIVAPLPGSSQFMRARIMSVGRGSLPLLRRDGLVLTVSRPLPGIGEPILDTNHRVLGFVAGAGPSSDSGNSNEAVVYLIKQLLSSAQKILRADGDIHTGWIGVGTSIPKSPTDAGITLSDVMPGGPAQKAGLKSNDTVTKWNGKPITDESQFIQMVMDTPIGSSAAIEFLRDGERHTTTALIEARKPQPKSLPFDFRQFMNSPDMGQPVGGSVGFFMGIEMVQVTPRLAEVLQMPGRTGLLVSNVEPNTPFFQAGVLVGDVIIAVDGQPVRDSATLLSRVQSLGRSGRVLLRLVRKGTEQSTTVQISGQPPQ